MPLDSTAIARFWSKVDKSGDCWLWTAGKSKGYGQFSPTRRTHIYAHRLSHELAYGTIPEGLKVCHRCDTPLCVRPDHLFLGTPADNVHDRMSKGRPNNGPRGETHHYRARPELVRRGERSATAKVSAADVVAIRALRGEGVVLREIAARFGLSTPHVCDIVNRRCWKHIP